MGILPYLQDAIFLGKSFNNRSESQFAPLGNGDKFTIIHSCKRHLFHLCRALCWVSGTCGPRARALRELATLGKVPQVVPLTSEVWILALLVDRLCELQNVSSPLGASVCLSAKWVATAVLTVFV